MIHLKTISKYSHEIIELNEWNSAAVFSKDRQNRKDVH